jgi:hypothetical protein
VENQKERSFGRAMRMWEDISKMKLLKAAYENVDWFQQADDSVHERAVEINLGVPKSGIFRN